MYKINTTPPEALELIQDFYGNKWQQEIRDNCNIILGCATFRKINLTHAAAVCLDLKPRICEQIKFSAALAFLLNTNHVSNRLNAIKNELQQLTCRSANIENAMYNTTELGYTRAAIYKRVDTLKLEANRLQYAQKDLANISVEAEIVAPNKPQKNCGNNGQ